MRLGGGRRSVVGRVVVKGKGKGKGMDSVQERSIRLMAAVAWLWAEPMSTPTVWRVWQGHGIADDDGYPSQGFALVIEGIYESEVRALGAACEKVLRTEGRR